METMPHVQKAAILAAETCQTVFQDRRWNCSSIITAPYLTPDLTRGKYTCNLNSYSSDKNSCKYDPVY
jgi:hypothetical protein